MFIMLYFLHSISIEDVQFLSINTIGLIEVTVT